jgi:hypothetical protein
MKNVLKIVFGMLLFVAFAACRGNEDGCHQVIKYRENGYCRIR